MKKFFETFIVKALVAAAFALPVVVSCEEYDDTEIWEAIAELQHRLDSMENAVAANVTAIQSMVSLGSISSWEYDAATGKGTITLLDGKTITVDQTVKGYSLITVRQDEDGKYYWALCKDGDTEFLEIEGKKVPVATTPALKISDDKEWLISVDGGSTWVSTGILYQEVSEDGADDDVTPLVEFFKDVKQDGNYLVLTLSDGTVIKVEIVGEAGITASVEKLWFSRAGMEKSVAVEMVNVKSYTITEKPEGWKALIEDDAYLYVTAPENFIDYPSSGTVKVLALFEGGLSPQILAMDVAYEPSFAMSVVNGKIAVTMSENTAEDYNGYVINAWTSEEYSDETAVKWFNDNNETLVARQGTAAYTPSDIIDDYSENEDYVVVAVPYLPVRQVAMGTLKYEISDLSKISLEGVNSQFSVSDIRFDGAVLNAVIDIPEYYGGFMKLEDWNNYGCDNFLETLKSGGGISTDVQTYSGPANAFPDGEDAVDMNPDTEYVIWYLPVASDGKYDAADFITYTFRTSDITFDPSIVAPAYEVTEVTVSGCTAKVTPGEEMYKTYAAIVKSNVIPDDNKEVVKYLIDVNTFSEGSAALSVRNYSLSEDDEVYLLAVSLTEDGKYGVLQKQKIDIKTLEYDENLSVEVTGMTNGVGDVTLDLAFTGSPVEITYYASTFLYYADETFQEMLALKQYGEATSVEISKLNGKLVIEGLSVGENYTFYAVVRDAQGNCSKLYKYDFIPEVNAEYIMSEDDDYSYGMPVLTGTKSGSSSSYTLKLDVEKPAECVKYWLYKGDPEYFTGDPWIDTDKVVTMALSGVTVHTSSESALSYPYMNSASRIYMVWLDDNGGYHAIYEYNPNN